MQYVLDQYYFLLQVFDRGDINTYFEYYHLAQRACKLLHDFLWDQLKNDVSYSDKSIFVEEHALLVAIVIRDRLARKSVPLISEKIRKAAIVSLVRIITFLERVPLAQSKFKHNLRSVLSNAPLRKYSVVPDLTEMRRLDLLLAGVFSSFLTQWWENGFGLFRNGTFARAF